MDTLDPTQVLPKLKPKKGVKPTKIIGHPMEDQIVQALLRKDTPQKIAQWVKPKVSVSAIREYGLRLRAAVRESSAAPSAMAQALQARGLLTDSPEVAEIVEATSAVLAQSDPLLSRVRRNYEALDDQMVVELAKPPSKRNAAAICGLVSTDLRAVEMEARLTRRLDSPAQGLSITIVTPHSPTPDIKSPIRQIGTK